MRAATLLRDVLCQQWTAVTLNIKGNMEQHFIFARNNSIQAEINHLGKHVRNHLFTKLLSLIPIDSRPWTQHLPTKQRALKQYKSQVELSFQLVSKADDKDLSDCETVMQQQHPEDWRLDTFYFTRPLDHPCFPEPRKGQACGCASAPDADTVAASRSLPASAASSSPSLGPLISPARSSPGS